MRGIKTTTVSILAVGLLAGSAVGVAAQDEPNMEAAEVTGLEDSVGMVDNPDPEQVGDVLLGEDLVIRHSWDTDDSRLSGVRTTTMNWGWHNDSSSNIEVMTIELTNDGGSWVGEARGYGSGESVRFFALDGRDGYEGLSAFVLVEYDENDADEFGSLRGIIFPAAMPEVPEAYAGE